MPVITWGTEQGAGSQSSGDGLCTFMLRYVPTPAATNFQGMLECLWGWLHDAQLGCGFRRQALVVLGAISGTSRQGTVSLAPLSSAKSYGSNEEG